MKNKKTIFNPIKAVGILVFLMAFTLNIQASLNGEWELVNVGFAQDSDGSDGDGGSGGGRAGADGFGMLTGSNVQPLLPLRDTG